MIPQLSCINTNSVCISAYLHYICIYLYTCLFVAYDGQTYEFCTEWILVKRASLKKFSCLSWIAAGNNFSNSRTYKQTDISNYEVGLLYENVVYLLLLFFISKLCFIIAKRYNCSYLLMNDDVIPMWECLLTPKHEKIKINAAFISTLKLVLQLFTTIVYENNYSLCQLNTVLSYYWDLRS